MRPKAEWAIDSEPMRARGIIVLITSKIQLVGKKGSRQNKTSEKHDSAAIVLVFKAGAFCY